MVWRLEDLATEMGPNEEDAVKTKYETVKTEYEIIPISFESGYDKNNIAVACDDMSYWDNDVYPSIG